MKKSPSKPRLNSALLLVEGETEEEFYSQFLKQFAQNTPQAIVCLKGNFNINSKILDSASSYLERHPDRIVDIFVCVDQERLGAPPFNLKKVTDVLEKIPNFRRIIPVIAILTIESLFFLDLDGIYRFLRAKKSLRNHRKYSNFRSLTHEDLSVLFRRFEKVYHKGRKCEGLVTSLDFNRLLTARELSRLRQRLDELSHTSR